MNKLFWICIILEFAALAWYLYQIFLIYSGRSGYIEIAHPEMYRKNAIPAGVFFIIISAALVTRFWLKSPKVATWIALSPAIIFVAALIGMVIASMFIRDWR